MASPKCRRDGLAYKIAEAIVDQRYGKETYRAPATSDAATTSSEQGD